MIWLYNGASSGLELPNPDYWRAQLRQPEISFLATTTWVNTQQPSIGFMTP